MLSEQLIIERAIGEINRCGGVIRWISYIYELWIGLPLEKRNALKVGENRQEFLILEKLQISCVSMKLSIINTIKAVKLLVLCQDILESMCVVDITVLDDLGAEVNYEEKPVVSILYENFG